MNNSDTPTIDFSQFRQAQLPEPQPEKVETFRLCGIDFEFAIATPVPRGEIRVMAEGKCLARIVNI